MAEYNWRGMPLLSSSTRLGVNQVVRKKTHITETEIEDFRFTTLDE